MAKKNLIVWFDDKGNLLTRVRPWVIQNQNAKSEDGKDFQDDMGYVRLMDGGQSHAGRVYLVSDKTNRQYSMFLDDFDAVIKAKLFVDNHIIGTFSFVKRGQSQAIKLVLPEDANTRP